MSQLNARQRRQILDWHLAHGENIAATCARFGVSRATFYRWRARHAAHPDQPLRAQSRRPHTRRGPAWSREEIVLFCDLTRAHPTWGRDRLTGKLAAQTGTSRSPATVGRMLARIRKQCPICKGHEGCHDDLAHMVDTVSVQLGVAKPLRRPPPDPEKTAERRAKAALRREQAATVREAEAISRRRR